jgi:hypothetical protein
MAFNAFWKWFGDSKVVDENGDPLVVYHGTSNALGADFSEFHMHKLGAHFGSIKQAEKRGWESADEENPLAIYSVFLRIENPVRLQDWGDAFDDVESDFWLEFLREVKSKLDPETQEAMRRDKYRPTTHRDVIGLLEGSGYDGIIYRNAYEGTGDSYVVFNPEQIKSVDNRGTWDADDPDIRHNPPRRMPKFDLPFEVEGYAFLLALIDIGGQAANVFAINRLEGEVVSGGSPSSLEESFNDAYYSELERTANFLGYDSNNEDAIRAEFSRGGRFYTESDKLFSYMLRKESTKAQKNRNEKIVANWYRRQEEVVRRQEEDADDPVMINPPNYRKLIHVKAITTDPWQFVAYERWGDGYKQIGEICEDRSECYQQAKAILMAREIEQARLAGYSPEDSNPPKLSEGEERLLEDIFSGKRIIDGMYTRDIADKYGISRAKVLKHLLPLANFWQTEAEARAFWERPEHGSNESIFYANAMDPRTKDIVSHPGKSFSHYVFFWM